MIREIVAKIDQAKLDKLRDLVGRRNDAPIFGRDTGQWLFVSFEAEAPPAWRIRFTIEAPTEHVIISDNEIIEFMASAYPLADFSIVEASVEIVQVLDAGTYYLENGERVPFTNGVGEPCHGLLDGNGGRLPESASVAGHAVHLEFTRADLAGRARNSAGELFTHICCLN